jgi:sugar lactone lactonase YvrE
LLAGLAVFGGPFVVAQGAAAQEGPPEGCEVVAEGLVNPRQIAFGDDGTLYVTEAGSGGDEVLTPPAEEAPEEVLGTPAAEVVEEAATPPPDGGEPPPTRGDTGQVTAVAPDGTQSVLATGLASYSFGSGPVGIVAAGGVVWVAVGGAGPSLGLDQIPTENSVVSIDPATGTVAVVAELGTFEVDNNPDGTDVNPNLYGMDLGAEGQLYVADAGGNTVFRVDPATSTFTLLGVIPERPLPGAATPEAAATPAAEAPTLQAVPTAVEVGADGNVYVGLLGEPQGSAQILIAQADGSFIEAVTGLTAVVGVALGPDGALYASQLTTDFEAFAPGNVVRVNPDGTSEPVVEGLPVPHGIAFGADGALYVVTNSLALGPGEPQGQVLRCELEGVGGEVGTPTAARLDAA